ncbi:helix-turn-helix domain-containing protein [Rhizobium leguminosarum]|uniref:helix-turn-helix domain-containing protein n=1 Tax=Rhizobium leguminosarum TaxID=384 RepID=UPI0010306BB6|nr:helix-turn-helix transcriptional regulator [Rhizobium leguminosarum]TAV74720.1 XRE family transcriptional regulator [Rhizobium leguminosarum]TAV79319.1 XRE family transcriptional regulator [Rhizobium leguminosarum]
MDFSPGSFRAARALLGKAQDDVAEGSGVDRRVVMRLEKTSYAKPTDAAHRVRRYYEGEGIEFLGADDQAGPGVRWKTVGQDDFFRRRQVQAARVMINLSQTQLALRLGVVRSVVTKYESGAVKTPDPEFIERAMSTLQDEGVTFLPDEAAKGTIGVRMSQPTS